jgi:hypothetical protein
VTLLGLRELCRVSPAPAEVPGMRTASSLVSAVLALVLGVAMPVAAAGVGHTPKAHCGPGSLPETGLQGEVPMADQFDGRSQQGYRCNLALVGQYAGNGGAIMMAWSGHCAYMATGYSPTDPDYNKEKGVVVIDVSDPRHPVETTRLQTGAMINPWEALKANARSGLLATGEGGSFPLAGPGAAGPEFDVYDVKTNCAHPRLDSDLNLPHARGHEGDFSPDGRTYYQSSLQAAPSTSVDAIDVSDPQHPHELAQFESKFGPVHALQIGHGGNRGYFMVAGMNAGSGDNDGLVIVDTSEVQQRQPHAKIRVISHVFWHDAGEAQIGRLVHINGHPYVITTDEFGAETTPAQACKAGQAPYGFVHIVDVANELHPRVINTIRLQVNDPANCSRVVTEQNAPFSLMYSAHYCTADNPEHTTAIACGWISSGVRVFDVRDPMHPREIAYYNPPARLDANSIRGGAPYYDVLVGLRTKDSVATQIRWAHDPRTGEPELWFMSGENGFQVVKFTNGVYPFAGHAGSGAVATRTRTAPAAVRATARGAILPATGESPLIACLGATVLLAGLFAASRLSRR